jgi:hypothetical protein
MLTVELNESKMWEDMARCPKSSVTATFREVTLSFRF